MLVHVKDLLVIVSNDRKFLVIWADGRIETFKRDGLKKWLAGAFLMDFMRWQNVPGGNFLTGLET